MAEVQAHAAAAGRLVHREARGRASERGRARRGGPADKGARLAMWLALKLGLAGLGCAAQPAPPPPPPIVCAQGFVKNATTLSCDACPGGTFLTTGMLACTGCGRGFHSAPGSAECSTCPRGSYCPSLANPSPPPVCPAGNYTDAFRTIACPACTEGHACSANTTTPSPCPAGTSAPEGSAACTDCAAGSYSSGRTALVNFTALDEVGVFGPGTVNDTGACLKMQAIARPANCDNAIPASYAPQTSDGFNFTCRFDDGVPGIAGDMSGDCAFKYDRGSCTFLEPNVGCSFVGFRTSIVFGGMNANCTECPAGTKCPAAGLSHATPCDKGYTSNASSVTCTACLPGTYSASVGAPTCNVCPGGYVCPAEATVIPTRCGPGTYAPRGSTVCQVCPLGHRCGRGTTTPRACINGTYAAEGSDTCSLCEAGFTSDAASDTCYKCPAGTRCPTTGTFSPINCPAGFASEAGSTGCERCEAGTYAATPRSPVCLSCPPRTRCPVTGMVTPIDCLRDEYSRYELQPESVAFELPYNSTEPDRQPSLLPNGALECTACPSGYTCPVDSTAPELCPIGTYRISAGGTIDNEDLDTSPNIIPCLPCTLGHACAAPNSNPVACVSGTYALVGFESCVVCAAGYACPSTTDSTQVRCTSGTFSDGGAPKCTTCPRGMECPDSADSSFNSFCANGTFSDGGQAFCTPCAPGFACPDSFDSSFNAPCPGGTYSPGLLMECLECPMGTYSNVTEATRLEQCLPCPVGTYGNETALNSKNRCLECPEDTYCSIPGLDAPLVCPEGTSTFGEVGVTDPSACLAPSPPPAPPVPPSPPLPPPLPPLRAERAPALVLRIDTDPIAFNDDFLAKRQFRRGIASVLTNVTIGMVQVVGVTSGSAVVHFGIFNPNDGVTPVYFDAYARAHAELAAAYNGGALDVGYPILPPGPELRCPPGTAQRLLASGVPTWFADDVEACGEALAKLGAGSPLRGAAFACLPCAPGYHAPDFDMPECVACAPGSAVGSASATKCELCARGTAAPSAASSMCPTCRYGTIAPTVGAVACEECGAEGYTSTMGAVSCLVCPIRLPQRLNRTLAPGSADATLKSHMLEACGFNRTIDVAVVEDVEDVGYVYDLTFFVVLGTFIVLTATSIALFAARKYKEQRLMLAHAPVEAFFEAVRDDVDEDQRGRDDRTLNFDLNDIARVLQDTKPDDGNVPDSDIVLGRILARKHNLGDAIHMRAIIHLRVGELDEAREILSQVLEASPKAHYHITMGQILEGLNLLEKASEQYQIAWRRDPTLLAAPTNFANVCVKRGLYAEAVKGYEAVRGIEPRFYKANYNLGCLYFRLKRYADAIEAFTAAHDANPRSIRAYFNKGIVLCELGRHTKATSAFRRCVLMDETFAPAYAKLGNIALFSGKPKTAAENYLMALERDPRQLESLVNLATIEWSKGNHPMAEALLKTAHEYDDTYFIATYNLGVLMMEKKDFARAVELYRHALYLRPDSAAAMHSLGTALRSVGKIEGETPRATAAERSRFAKAAQHVDRAVESLSAHRQERKVRLANMSLAAAQGLDVNEAEAPNRWKQAAQNPEYTRLAPKEKSAQQAVFGGEGAKAAAIADGEVDEETEEAITEEKEAAKRLIPVHLRSEAPRWQRLILISNRIKHNLYLHEAVLKDVAVVGFDWAHDTLDDVWDRVQRRLFMHRQRCKVLSIGLLAPSKPGRISLVQGDKISLQGIERARIGRFLECLASVLAPKLEIKGGGHGGRLDLLNFGTSDEDGHMLVQKLRHRFHIPDVIASTNAMRPEGHRAVDSEGMRAAALYFDLKKLGK